MTKHSISYTLEQIWLLPPFVWQWLALKLLPTLEIVACHSCHLMWCHKPGYPVCQSNISLVRVGRSATSYSRKCLQTNCKIFKMSIYRIKNNNAFGVEFLWKITLQLKAIPFVLQCASPTAHNIATSKVALIFTGCQKRRNKGHNFFSLDCDNASQLKRCWTWNLPQGRELVFGYKGFKGSRNYTQWIMTSQFSPLPENICMKRCPRNDKHKSNLCKYVKMCNSLRVHYVL